MWSWDISRLVGPAPRVWFYLYVIIDIWSRKIVGWTIDTDETARVAKRLIQVTCKRNGVTKGQVKMHSDRGAPITGASDLGVSWAC